MKKVIYIKPGRGSSPGLSEPAAVPEDPCQLSTPTLKTLNDRASSTERCGARHLRPSVGIAIISNPPGLVFTFEASVKCST